MLLIVLFPSDIAYSDTKKHLASSSYTMDSFWVVLHSGADLFLFIFMEMNTLTLYITSTLLLL